MSEQQTAMRAMEQPPMYLEARRYCEEHGLGVDDFERVRTMLAVREFVERCKPYHRAMADIVAATPVAMIYSEGYVRSDLPKEVDDALKQVQVMIDLEAEKLGLTVPAR